MLKKIYLLAILFIVSSLFFTPAKNNAAESLAYKLKGRILLQVEANGEAWYINPVDLRRHYLGRPTDAFNIMRQLGLGISNNDFNKLASTTPSNLLGRILIKVEDSGKAYYIYPVDKKAYYLGRPTDAFNIMRQLGLGISNASLEQIIASSGSSSTVLEQMEKRIQELVNDERSKNGLSRVKWNDEVAAVAREHSRNQAEENKNLIFENRLCSYPFIHHEGTIFGIYQSERLRNKNVQYFSMSAENIALIPKSSGSRYQSTGITQDDCQADVNVLNQNYKDEVATLTTTEEKIAFVKQEISSRANLVKNSPLITIIETFYNTASQVESATVNGWMNSPGHRKNILTPDYDEAGMGVAEVNGYYIITQVFIKRASCGYKGGACCQQAGYYPSCYVPWTCQSNLLCQ